MENEMGIGFYGSLNKLGGAQTYKPKRFHSCSASSVCSSFMLISVEGLTAAAVDVSVCGSYRVTWKVCLEIL